MGVKNSGETMQDHGVISTNERRGCRNVFRRWWELVRKPFTRQVISAPIPETPPGLEPLHRVILHEEVERTLLDEYAQHRRTERGNEETGWLLLGLRRGNEAIVQATLPAGARSDTGVAHVHFNSLGQIVGSRMVRQSDKRLIHLGIVHTHPGNLRHPSSGDLEGDRVWIQTCRGGEGIFGIGTAGEEHLRFNWYTLRGGENTYRPFIPETTPGEDLARPLHEVWSIVEEHAPALQRLYSQQAGLHCQVIDHCEERTLAVLVPLAEKGDWVRVLLSKTAVRYLVKRDDNIFQVDPEARTIDQGVYRLLAELSVRET